MKSSMKVRCKVLWTQTELNDTEFGQGNIFQGSLKDLEEQEQTRLKEVQDNCTAEDQKQGYWI